jgi:hypothetical protein
MRILWDRDYDDLSFEPTLSCSLASREGNLDWQAASAISGVLAAIALVLSVVYLAPSFAEIR